VVIDSFRNLRKRIGIEPYWYLILPLLLAGGILFANHLRTGTTPSRVFISPFDFDIFWYGICIMGGIALGAYVVSHLVSDRGKFIFRKIVPNSVRRKSVNSLKLPDEINLVLAKRNIRTLGSLLLPWGFDPRRLGLNREGLEQVQTRLEATPGVKSEWVTDAPWRPWNPDHVWNGVVWSLILGVIGARLYHVLTPSPSNIYSTLDYFRSPFQLINLRDGGLGIYGGIAGGALGLFWYSRRQRLPAIALADLAVIGMALGQVFGRWGNFFNQELYGRPTDLPWGISIDPQHILPGYGEVDRFHPAFLYESLWSLLTFLVLLTLLKRHSRKLMTGDLTALYLIFYSVGRILLETVRLDSKMVTLGGTTINLAVASLVSIIVALFMVAWRAYPRLRAGDD
jgi:phosphatidylglycerol:prolipoprotein diacylglycerol transferase